MTMTDYIYTVTVNTDTYDHAEQVMSERLGPDEDYGFDYTVEWKGDVSAELEAVRAQIAELQERERRLISRAQGQDAEHAADAIEDILRQAEDLLDRVLRMTSRDYLTNDFSRLGVEAYRLARKAKAILDATPSLQGNVPLALAVTRLSERILSEIFKVSPTDASSKP